MFLLQALQPVAGRVLWNCERDGIDLARAANPTSRAWPREKRQDCARRAACIAEIKVVGAGIIEIHSALDKAQSQQASVKIQIALRITGNRGDVMKSGNFDVHINSSLTAGTVCELRFYSVSQKQPSRGRGLCLPLRHGVAE